MTSLWEPLNLFCISETEDVCSWRRGMCSATPVLQQRKMIVATNRFIQWLDLLKPPFIHLRGRMCHPFDNLRQKCHTQRQGIPSVSSRLPYVQTFTALIINLVSPVTGVPHNAVEFVVWLVTLVIDVNHCAAQFLILLVSPVTGVPHNAVEFVVWLVTLVIDVNHCAAHFLILLVSPVTGVPHNAVEFVVWLVTLVIDVNHCAAQFLILLVSPVTGVPHNAVEFVVCLVTLVIDVSSAGGGPSFPLMYQQPSMVYASPAPGMPNGGVIFSLGSDTAGRGQFIIPLPLGPAQAAAADLSKAKK
ncbi:hypothetical protein J6590_024036 [Homalodisca vitripennis]|nr:hypothetical protein J6590_024036 [Homalodisca vitripennis]